MKVAVTGSSGLIGTALVASLRADGHEVIRLVRRASRAPDEVRWDPRAADAGLISSGAPGPSALNGLGACVHLAGAGVADHRWTARYKAEIRASRILGTRALAGALAKLGQPPATRIAASADAGLTSSGAPGPSALNGLGACVHLAGAGVADHRWTARYKAEIRASRILGTRALAGALAKFSPVPATLVAASAIGWYGDTGGREVDESAPSGPSFLARLVRDWEAAAEPAANAGIRVVHPRSGLILTPRGGLLARMLPLARLGLLPRFSSGRQVMSWISLSDEVAALTFLLGREDVSGPVNLTAPAPVTNAEFTAALSAAAGRRDLPWLRVPAPALRLAVGEASVELLTSARVTSRRLQQAGYEFRSATLPEALAAELASG